MLVQPIFGEGFDSLLFFHINTLDLSIRSITPKCSIWFPFYLLACFTFALQTIFCWNIASLIFAGNIANQTATAVNYALCICFVRLLACFVSYVVNPVRAQEINNNRIETLQCTAHWLWIYLVVFLVFRLISCYYSFFELGFHFDCFSFISLSFSVLFCAISISFSLHNISIKLLINSNALWSYLITILMTVYVYIQYFLMQFFPHFSCAPHFE